MKKIFWGFFFLFFSFNLSFDAISINLFPDFVGWLLILSGSKELCGESEHFGKVKPFAVILVIANIFTFVANLIGAGDLLENFNVILSIVLLIFEILAVYHLIEGLTDIEQRKHCDMNSSKIRTLWIVQLILSNGAYFLGFFFVAFALGILIGSFVIGILLLVYWNRNAKTYESIR